MAPSPPQRGPTRDGQIGLDPVRHRNGPRPRPAASVRLGERLVEVDVDDVEPHVAGPGVTHDRVQVGAVVVQGAAGVADHPGDLGDVLVEQAERVRVGEHQAGDLIVDLGAQVVDVDATALVRRHLDHLVARHGHRRGVGAVGGVRGQHLGALLAAVGVVGAGEEQPRQLPVGARRGLKADVLEPADLGQGALQAPHQLQRPLGALRVLRGVKARVAGQRGDPLVESRVVLHRAGAERIGARVEVEVRRERRL